MKIRNGFVSNSSSSSFCLVGYRIKEKELIKLLGVTEEQLEEEGISQIIYDTFGDDLECFSYDCSWAEGGWALIGKCLMDTDGTDDCEVKYDVDEVIAMKKFVEKKLNLPNTSKAKFGIYCGTRAC